MTPKQSFNNYLANSILWLIWDFSGLRFIYSKIRPAKLDSKERPPATFIIWVLGAYVAFFGVASQRYENRIDIIENRANTIFAQLSTESSYGALSRVARVQSMSCPQKPNIYMPISVIRSLFGKDVRYEEMVELLKEIVENWKESLLEVDLSKADLEGVNFSEAYFGSVNFEDANLQNTNLYEAQFNDSRIKGANLKGANLHSAHLELLSTFNTMEDAFKVLSNVSTLYKATLPPKLGKALKDAYPHLFEEPGSSKIPSQR